jgi:hypothetical protein
MEHPLTCSNNASPTIPSISTTKNVIQVQALDAATVTDITTNPVKQTAIQLPANATIRPTATDIIASAISRTNPPIVTDVSTACINTTSIGSPALPISTSIGSSAPPIPTTTKRFPRWTVVIKGVYYQQRQPSLKNHITFRCIARKDIGDDKKWMEKKNKNIQDKKPLRCNGKFELTGWTTDPQPHLLNIITPHDCHGKFPSLDEIGQFFDKVKNGDGIINQRQCEKSNAEYANMLRIFIEVSSTKMMATLSELEKDDNETMVEFIPDIDGDMDMRDLFTIHCPPEMIRQSFLKSVTDNIQIIDTDKRGGWKALTGGNGMRFHFPDMETQQPRLYRLIKEASWWYIKRIQQWHPEMQTFNMNVLQSSPGAHAQEQLHLDYSTLCQVRPANQQPMSAIIAIEQFDLDIVSCKTTEKLDTVTILPGCMIVFTNKCIHRGGANQTVQYQRRIFMYIANVEADINKNLLQCCHWDAEKKMYVGDEKPTGKVYTTRRNRLVLHG